MPTLTLLELRHSQYGSIRSVWDFCGPLEHRDPSILIGKANKHCKDIACSRPFEMCLTSGEGQKLEYFEWTPNNIYIRIWKFS